MPDSILQNMSKAELIEELEGFRYREVLFKATEKAARIGQCKPWHCPVSRGWKNG